MGKNSHRVAEKRVFGLRFCPLADFGAVFFAVFGHLPARKLETGLLFCKTDQITGSSKASPTQRCMAGPCRAALLASRGQNVRICQVLQFEHSGTGNLLSCEKRSKNPAKMTASQHRKDPNRTGGLLKKKKRTSINRVLRTCIDLRHVLGCQILYEIFFRTLRVYTR